MPEIRCPLEAAAEHHGDRPALISGARILSWRELRRRVARVAAALRHSGCNPGDRIGILTPAGPESLIRILAVLRIGAVCCPMNTRLPRPSLARLLRRIDCHKLVVEAARAGGFGDVTTLDSRELGEWRGRGEHSPGDRAVPLERPATILFTSGSAGVPKAVLHTWGNHYYSALGSNMNLPLRPGDRWMLDLPLHHVSGLGIVFRCLLAGAAMVLRDRDDAMHGALNRHAITHLSAVVTQLHRLLQAPESVRFPSLRCLLLGGSGASRRLLDRGAARGLPVFTTYGCTEMASQVTTTGIDSTTAQRLTSGKLLPYRRLRIGREGEILLRGETLFRGYVDSPGLTRDLDRDGWFASGDIGHVDEAGYLSVVGRRDNRFFSGGETIHPEEIERALSDHDDIVRAVVVPVPDEEFGQRCVAFVQPHEQSPDPATLASWLRRTLPRYMVPDAFYTWPDTLQEAFKVDRTRFARLAREGAHTPLAGKPCAGATHTS